MSPSNRNLRQPSSDRGSLQSNLQEHQFDTVVRYTSKRIISYKSIHSELHVWNILVSLFENRAA